MRTQDLALLSGLLMALAVVLGFSAFADWLPTAFPDNSLYGLLPVGGLNFILAICILAVLGIFGLQALLLLSSTSFLFPYYYRETLAWLEFTDLPVLIGSEEVAVTLREKLFPSRLAFANAEAYGGMERHILFCAEYIELLKHWHTHPGTVPARLAAQGRFVAGTAWLERLTEPGCSFLGCMSVLALFGLPLLLLASWHFPAFIISRARACAICDYLLSECRVPPRAQDPPQERSWIQQQAAPWLMHESADKLA